MSTTQVIEGYIAGDELDIVRDVTDVVTSDPLIKAWFTVKAQLADLDAAALVQKVITVAVVPGTGQITGDGSESGGNGTATLVFQLTKAETAALGYEAMYRWDIQVKTAAGKIYTPFDGRLHFGRGATDATS